MGTVYLFVNLMNATISTEMPEDHVVDPELSFEEIWDSAAVAELIRSKCDLAETPALLFLGKKEAKLLRDHLASVFDADEVMALKGTYYMGLEVVELDCETFLMTGGRKSSRVLQDPISRRPAWRDRETVSNWQFRA